MKSMMWTGAAVATAVLAAACGGSKPAEAPAPAPIVQAAAPAAPAPAPQMKPVLIADFATADKKNALGGEFGAWASDKPAPVGKSMEEVLSGAGEGGTGAWKITYDISNPGSYSGTWMRLASLDASAAKNLVISVKGEGEFSPDFIVELKVGEGPAQKVGRYVVKGVTKDYAKVTIPLSGFAGLTDFKPLYELTFVYDDQTCPVKKGTYLVDHIELQ